MRKLLSVKICFLGCAVIWLAGLVPLNVQAREPAREFLDALRERGYHDVAIDYLNSMKTSRLAPVEMKEILLYELGVTLVAASKTQRDVTLREQQLDEARDALQRFVGRHSDHELAASASNQLGNLLVERALIKVDLSNKPGEDKAALLSSARELYDEASKVFARQEVDLKEKLKSQGVISEKEKEKLKERKRLRADFLQTLLLAAAVKEEKANAVQKGSEEYTALLTDAASRYADINKKHRTLLAGQYAQMYLGRCNQKMGKYKDALSFYEDVLNQTEIDEFRPVKTKTLLLALECWEKSKPPLYAVAVQKVEPWVEGARPNEEKTTSWLQLRLELARAQVKLAQQLKEKDPKDAQAKRLSSDARKNASFVSRVPGDLKSEAERFLDEQFDITRPKSGEGGDPKTFAEAMQAGKQALDAMKTANLVLSTVPQRIAKETDQAVKTQLEQQVKDAQEALTKAVADGKRYYQLALGLVDELTDVRDVNIARYFLCFLHFSTQDYYEAGLVGEFVARRYPDSAGARPSAEIAMVAYLKLYENEGDDKEFEKDHIVAIANYIIQQWPDHPKTVDARNTLLQFMIQAGDLDMAEKYLNDIPEDSPKRGDAEIKTGQAMWSSYLTGMQQLRQWESGDEPTPPEVDIDAKKTTLDQMKGRAHTILAKGVQRMQKAGGVTEATVAAAFSLAQIYVDAEQVAEAVKLLEDETIGPLTLVKAGHAAVARDGFDADVYKTALRAYISSLAGAGDGGALMDKATEVMDAMKAAIPQDKLIEIYYSLARDLEEQIKLASPEAKKPLSKGFEEFLERLRDESKELSVRHWVASTFVSLGRGLDSSAQLVPEAKGYYLQAVETYETILEEDEKEKDEKKKLSADIKTQMRLHLARTKKRLGKFKDARVLYTQILTDRNMTLDVQAEAAKLYQEWADVWAGHKKADDKARAVPLYEMAMRGAQKGGDGKNIIWGWARMFQITARYPDFRKVFHEARYNLAMCFYKLGRLKKTTDEQKEWYGKAERAILQTQKLYGKGDDWKAKRPDYDALMRDIQRALGERATGLPADPAPPEPKEAVTE